ncbi:hypothetical protein GGQ92_002065 [Gracilibacillus halotolerans]|uniref:Uncharacterized protein n=1 Tax=Gracilibacillus halotolerans TaxID=74386 RepID=A0A841RKL4_9BACI|nr:hypothetical protein [Gracilibacillus halotolerans]MBB6513261.1 hypothetical protein [Gracilibacillus halotolerans]
MVSVAPRLIISTQKLYNDLGTQPIFEISEKVQAGEELLEDLVVFHNPHATRPFNVSSFYHPKLAHFSGVSTDIPHRTLLQREVIVIGNSMVGQ